MFDLLAKKLEICLTGETGLDCFVGLLGARVGALGPSVANDRSIESRISLLRDMICAVRGDSLRDSCA